MIDFHCDTLMKLMINEKENMIMRKNSCQVDLEKLIEGGSKAQFFAMFVDLEECLLEGIEPFEKMKKMNRIFWNEMKNNSDIIKPALSWIDYKKNIEENKISAFLTVEEGGIVGDSIEKIQELHDIGVRLITLTWNYENQIGYPGCYHKNLGLKSFGFEAVEFMEKLGIIIDVSHLSDRGFWDVYDTCKKPFIASHSNARGVCNHKRNLTDDMIKAISERGGVIGLNYCDEFIENSGITTISGMVRHIKHLVRIGGEDVVVLGSDFDGIDCKLEVNHIGECYKLFHELKRQGYGDDFIDKIRFRNGERIIKELL